MNDEGGGRRDRAGLLRGLVRRGPRAGGAVRCTPSWSSARPARSAARTPASRRRRGSSSSSAGAAAPRTRPTTRSRSRSWTSTTTSPRPSCGPRSTASTSTCSAPPTGGGSSTRSGSSRIRTRGRRREGPRSRQPRATSRATASRLHYEVTGDGGPTILLLPTLDGRPQAVLEGAGALPVATLPGRVVRRPGQRPLRPPARPRGIPPRRPGPARPGGARRHRDRPRRGRRTLPRRRLGPAARRRARRPRARRRLHRPVARHHRRPRPRVAEGDPADLPASRVPFIERDPVEHWAKYDPAYWRTHHEDFLWFFFGMCFPEPHSTKQIEDCVGWGLDTTPDVLAAEAEAARPSRETVEAWCRAVTSPVLAIHGDHDLISPPSRGRRIAELTGGECVVLEGAGHIPLARDPVRVNLLIRDFAQRFDGAGRGVVKGAPGSGRVSEWASVQADERGSDRAGFRSPATRETQVTTRAPRTADPRRRRPPGPRRPRRAREPQPVAGRGVPDGLWVFDAQGNTVLANARMAQLLGAPPTRCRAVGLRDPRRGRAGPVRRAPARARGQRATPAATSSAASCARTGNGSGRWSATRRSRTTTATTSAGCTASPSTASSGNLIDTLQRREAQLAEAQHIAKIGSWEWDVGSDVVSAGPTSCTASTASSPARTSRRTTGGSSTACIPTTGTPSKPRSPVRSRRPASSSFDARIFRKRRVAGVDPRPGPGRQGEPVRWRGWAARRRTSPRPRTRSRPGPAHLDGHRGQRGDHPGRGHPHDPARRVTAYRMAAGGRLAGRRRRRARHRRPGRRGTCPTQDIAEATRIAQDAVATLGPQASPTTEGTSLVAAPVVAEEPRACVIVMDTRATTPPTDTDGLTSAGHRACSPGSPSASGRGAARAGPRQRDERLAGQVRLPRDDEPRDPHPAQRRDRPVRAAAAHRARPPTSAGSPTASTAPGRSLLSLVNDILDLSKIEAGRLELEAVDFDPRAMVEQSTTLMAERARAKGLELAVACQPDVPAARVRRPGPLRPGRSPTSPPTP